jgi:hypothetical protein
MQGCRLTNEPTSRGVGLFEIVLSTIMFIGDEGVSPRSEPNTARHPDINDTVCSEGKAGRYPIPGGATLLPSCRKFNEGTNSAHSFHDPSAID